MNFTVQAHVGGRQVAYGTAYTLEEALSDFKKRLADYQRFLANQAEDAERAQKVSA